MLSAALLLLVSAGPEPIAWVHDDWNKAKAVARSQSKLVVVDAWATWCHSCLSMQNYVLKEPPVTKIAKDYVWLSLDYDLAKNTDFFRLFPVDVFPTFLVVDPEKELVVARWPGTATADQMASFITSAKPADDDPLTLGSRALAAADYAKAREIFEAGLKGKSERTIETRMVNGLVESLWRSDPKACAERGVELIDRTDDSLPGLDSMALVAYCAGSAPPELAQRIHAKIRTRLEAVIASPQFQDLVPDDRSGVYSTLVETLDALGEKAKGDEVTKTRLAMLEQAAKKAKTPIEATTFDAHRLECYLRLQKYDDAKKMLEISERVMPKDFNHPYRLALLHKAKGDTKAGLQAIDRALKRGYGPRKVRLYSTKIDLLILAGRLADARTTLTEARSEISRLDPKLVRKTWLTGLDAQEAQIAAKERAG
jgi:tetratricopeptide (TPR) repeat protein